MQPQEKGPHKRSLREFLDTSQRVLREPASRISAEGQGECRLVVLPKGDTSTGRKDGIPMLKPATLLFTAALFLAALGSPRHSAAAPATKEILCNAYFAPATNGITGDS